MTGRRRNKKGRDRQSKVDLSVMSPEERRQYKKKMRRIKEGKKKRRRAIVLWGALLLCLVIFVISQRKKLPSAEEMTSSIKENANGLMSVGGGFFDNDAEYESPSANTAAVRVEEAPVDPDYSVYEGKVDDLSPMATGTPLDVMHGRSAVDLSQVEDAQRANSAKAAMISNSYFDGTAQRVNSYLQNYGEGKWHALRGVTGDICVFYDGERTVHKTYEGNDGTIESNETVPFKIVFTVYEDGTFVVTDASEDGKSVDDMETYLKGIVSSGNN